jgi:hypothetical protein
VEWQLNLSLRSVAFMFAVYCVAVMLMPARYLFTLTGIGLICAGIFLVPRSTQQGLVAILGGIVLVGLGVRSVLLERRAADEDARQAADAARRISRRGGFR